MAHPHKNCTVCNSAKDTDIVNFVEACLEAKTSSYQVLFEHLDKHGFHITKEEKPS